MEYQNIYKIIVNVYEILRHGFINNNNDIFRLFTLYEIHNSYAYTVMFIPVTNAHLLSSSLA